jgi:hypothetical protein
VAGTRRWRGRRRMLDKIPIARYTRFVTAGRGGRHSRGVQSLTNPGIRGLNIASGSRATTSASHCATATSRPLSEPRCAVVHDPELLERLSCEAERFAGEVFRVSRHLVGHKKYDKRTQSSRPKSMV